MFKELYKTIIKGGKYYFFTSIIDRIASLFFFFVIAKLFTVEDYGEMVTVFVFANIVLTILNFGLPIFLQREASVSKDINSTFSSIMLIKIISFLIYYSIIFSYFYGINNEIVVSYVLLISTISLSANIISVIVYLYYGKDKVDVVFLSTVLSKFIFIFLIFLLKQNQATLLMFLIIYLVINIVQLIILSLKLNSIGIKLAFDFRFVKKSLEILQVSFPLGIAVALNFLYHKIDIILISQIIDSSSVGQYNISYSFYQLSGIIFGAIWIPSLNIFSKCKSYLESYKKLINISIIIFITSLIIIAIFYFLGEEIIIIILGEKYEQAASLIPFFSIAVLGYGLNGLTGNFLNANGRFVSLAIIVAIGLLINIIFNLIFLKILGILAAVYSTIITEYVILLIELCYIIYLKNIKSYEK